MKTILKSISFGAISLGFLFCNALASDSDGRINAVGAAIIVGTNPYAESEDPVEVVPVPALSWNKGRYSVVGKGAGIRLWDEGPWAVDAIADIRFQSLDAEISPVLEGMANRDRTLELGGLVAYKMGDITLSTQAQFDVLGAHEGFEVNMRARYDWQIARGTFFRPSLSLIYRNSDLANYYNGVLPDEARLATGPNPITVDGVVFDRPAYAPGETISPQIGFTAIQAFNPKWGAFAVGAVEILPVEITDSPIISEDYLGIIAVGVARIF
ncbi:MAG: MipA/OmpV family protein [Pseudomonadota bacterium]